MPYFVYRVLGFGMLEPLGMFDRYPDASAHAKALRAGVEAPLQAQQVRVIFAESAEQAEDLLCMPREPRPGAGDD